MAGAPTKLLHRRVGLASRARTSEERRFRMARIAWPLDLDGCRAAGRLGWMRVLMPVLLVAGVRPPWDRPLPIPKEVTQGRSSRLRVVVPRDLNVNPSESVASSPAPRAAEPAPSQGSRARNAPIFRPAGRGSPSHCGTAPGCGSARAAIEAGARGQEASRLRPVLAAKSISSGSTGVVSGTLNPGVPG